MEGIIHSGLAEIATELVARQMSQFSPARRRVIAFNLVGSSLSTIGSGGIILCYIFLTIKPHFRHRLIVNLAVSDFIYALSNTISGLWLVRNQIELLPGTGCIVNGFITQLSVQATDFSILAIAIVTFLSIKKKSLLSNNVRSMQFEILTTAGIWIIPCITAFSALAFELYGPVSGNWCWIRPEPHYARYVLTHMWRFAIIAAVIIIYTYLHFYIKNHFRQLRTIDNSHYHECYDESQAEKGVETTPQLGLIGERMQRGLGVFSSKRSAVKSEDGIAMGLPSSTESNQEYGRIRRKEFEGDKIDLIDRRQPQSPIMHGRFKIVPQTTTTVSTCPTPFPFDKGVFRNASDIRITQTAEVTVEDFADIQNLPPINNSASIPRHPEDAESIAPKEDFQLRTSEPPLSPSYFSPFATTKVSRVLPNLSHNTSTSTTYKNTLSTNKCKEREAKIQRVMLLRAYPIFYILLWLPGLANRIAEASGHRVDTLGLLQASTQFVGFANAITYGWNENIAAQIRYKFGKRGPDVERQRDSWGTH